MATVVQRFAEGAYVITADGEEIPVYEGMEIYPDDIIVGEVATIEIADEAVAAQDPGADPSTIPIDDIAALQQAILEGADPTQVGERTAAGAPAAGGPTADGGGSSFVTLDRSGAEVDPTAGYETTTFNAEVQQTQEEPPALVEPEVVEPTPEPIVTVTTETRTDVRTETETKTVVGDEYETGRTTETSSETTTDETGTTVTTTTVTTITYDKETNTVTTTTTITETYEREVTTTEYPSGQTTVTLGEWTLTDTQTDTQTETTTTNEPREQVVEDVDTEFTPVEPEEPTVTVTKEYDVVTNTESTVETVVGDEYETGRNTTTDVSEVATDRGQLVTTTTTTTTTITYNQETNTITTNVTTTEYYERDVTTTTYPDGTTEVVNSEWTMYDSATDTSSTTDTVETPRTEVLTDVAVDEVRFEPTVETVTETKEEVDVQTTTETVVGDEYETGRTTDTDVNEETTDRGQLVTKTTTTTTTVSYNQETDTVETTTTTTTTYSRDITTTTYPDGTTDVVTTDWEQTGQTSDVTESTDTVETPRTEVLTDVAVEETRFEPTVETITETKEEVDVQTKTETNVGDEYETGRTTETTSNKVTSEDGTKETTTTTTTTTVSYNQVTDTLTTTTTTTTAYSRDITTTTYPDGSKDVATTDWAQTGQTTDVDTVTDTVETPRQEVLTEDVVDVNLLPVAEDDTYETDEDTPVSGDVSDNDTDGDGTSTFSLIGEDIPGLVFSDNGEFTYTPSDEDGDQIVTFDYRITDEDGEYSDATVTINVEDVLAPEEPEELGQWFFSQGGNEVQPGYDYELVTDGKKNDHMEINVQNKQLGEHRVDIGDAVKFTIAVSGDAEYETDYTLNMVSKSPQVNIDSWSLDSGTLSVVISTTKDGFNLSGSTFAIEVTSVNEGADVGVEFDITSVVHYDASANQDIVMGTWESNDDVLIGLIDPNFTDSV